MIPANTPTWFQTRILSLSTPRATWGQRQSGRIVLSKPFCGIFSSKANEGLLPLMLKRNDMFMTSIIRQGRLTAYSVKWHKHKRSLFYFFGLRCVACGIFVPQPGIELVPPAVEASSPNHWTTREFPRSVFLALMRALGNEKDERMTLLQAAIQGLRRAMLQHLHPMTSRIALAGISVPAIQKAGKNMEQCARPGVDTAHLTCHIPSAKTRSHGRA